jgi:putative ABC transport system ATP-binding protein
MTESLATSGRAGAVLRARALVRTFGDGSRRVQALRGVDLDARPGRLLVVRGRSGSGKTTLLNLLAGLDRPDTGTVHLGEDEISAMSEPQLVDLRRRRVGVVFQAFGLVPILSAAENVGVPLRLVGTPTVQREERVAELLDLVGLSQHAAQRPHELSGGQQQRVALARALANSPQVLVADEPTGQLDSQTGRAVMDLLHRLIGERSVIAVVATHDPDLVALADEIHDLHDGRLSAATFTAQG